MKKKGYIVIGLGLLAILLLSKRVATWYDLVKDYLINWETYSPIPYWDVNRWSWGYGTRVPGSVDNRQINPGGSISQINAFIQSYSHIVDDFDYLDTLVRFPLTARQWAALLDFSYNTGPGNADNLIPNINNRNWVALKKQWLQYNKADGEYRQELYNRRLYEITEFLKDT